MSKLILSLWLAWFGGDVRDLSSKDYRTREDATKRLEAAGWWGAGVTWVIPATPEAEDRAARVWERLENRLPFMVQLWACCRERLSDEFVRENCDRILAHAVVWGPDRFKFKTSEEWKKRAFTSDGWIDWSREMLPSQMHAPWVTGSLENEYRGVLSCLKEVPDERRKPKPLPQPDPDRGGGEEPQRPAQAGER